MCGNFPSNNNNNNNRIYSTADSKGAHIYSYEGR